MKDLPTEITRDTITAFVRDMIVEMGVDATEITDSANLEDLGLDSLDVVELSQGVKKQLMVLVAPGDFADVETIADAINLIADKAGTK
jgi:acyl carrier protein